MFSKDILDCPDCALGEAAIVAFFQKGGKISLPFSLLG